MEHIKIDSAKRKRQLVAFKVPIHCRSLAERYFRQIFLHKEDVIVQQYAPIIEKVQLGRKGKTEENNHQLLTEYVCYFIVDLFSGQVPKEESKSIIQRISPPHMNNVHQEFYLIANTVNTADL